MQTNYKQSKDPEMLIWSRNFFFGLILFLFTGSMNEGLQAQDPVFSQFNMLPTRINPAFAGNTYAPLIHINSRIQWPSIDLAFNTMALSYDQYFYKLQSGFGFSLLNDQAGNGIFNTLRMEGLYSYRLKVRDLHFIKMGIGFALVQKRLNWEKLIFPDQIDPEFGHIDQNGNWVVSEESKPARLTQYYPDLTVGMLYYSPDFYFGFSLHHVNNPRENFLEFGGDGENGLANLYSVHFGWQLPLPYRFRGKDAFIQPSLFYARQENLNQFNLTLVIDMGMIYAGIGYRHGFDNPDAVILNAGFQSGLYKLGYSYDLTISKLSANSGGSHELGLIINFDGSEWFEKPGKYSDCFEIFR